MLSVLDGEKWWKMWAESVGHLRDAGGLCVRPMMSPASCSTLFHSLGKWPNLRVGGCLVHVEGRILGTGGAKSHTPPMAWKQLDFRGSFRLSEDIHDDHDGLGIREPSSFGDTKEACQILMWLYEKKEKGAAPHYWDWILATLVEWQLRVIFNSI